MPLWTFGTVESEPQVRLSDLTVREVTYLDVAISRTRHLVGCDHYDGSGRVSSAIASFDVLRRRASTRRGRVYELLGRSGSSANADYVWGLWCRINAVATFTDVTTELFASVVEKATEVAPVKPQEEQ